MGSASIRRRPHCFTLKHQLEKLVATGQTAEGAMTRWSDHADVQTALQIGKEEARAALNITLHVDSALVEMLGNAVKKYGMVKGPFAHSAIASPFLCLGSKPTSNLTAYYVENMGLTDLGSTLMGKRMVSDWEALPPQMRKSLVGDSMASLHLRVTGFCFACRIFQSQAGLYQPIYSVHSRFNLQLPHLNHPTSPM